MNIEEMRQIALDMIDVGVRAADAEELVKDTLDYKEGVLSIGDRDFKLSDYDDVIILGIGKASVPMASAFSRSIITDGLVLTNNITSDPTRCPVPIRTVDHPYPDESNLEASKELVSKIDGLRNALIIFLVSGGGSSMFTVPPDNVSIDDMTKLNRLLVTSGMNIGEINTIRKHVSQVKGGKFAHLCQGKGTLISLIISDVVGNDLSNIASGPTCADTSTYEDAVRVLKNYGLWNKIPENIRLHLERGMSGDIEENPKVVDAHNILIGDNMTALEAMKKFGDKKGFDSVILTDEKVGEARYAAKSMMNRVKKLYEDGKRYQKPIALISGGEMTVKVDETVKNMGGPNREFVLSSALDIQGCNIVVASVDSDGVDGCGKAGAIADGYTILRSSLDAEKYLEEHRTQDFFDAVGDSIEFESHTNVNDLTVVLVGERE